MRFAGIALCQTLTSTGSITIQKREFSTSACPTPVHEIVSTSLAEEISERLRSIAGSKAALRAKFAAQIVNGGSSRILHGRNSSGQYSLTATTGRTVPAWHAPLTGLVVEISYSQDGKELDKLAWQYIQGSNGDIKAVLRIDINYGAKASTVSLWRSLLLP